MTNDLEQRVNEVLETAEGMTQKNWYDYKRVWQKSFDLINIIKDQQAEINRLKSGQVRLRPIKELKTLQEITSIITVHQDHWPYGYAEPMYTNIGAYCPKDNRIRDTYGDKVSSNNILFFIEIPDLPTEIEVMG